MSNGVVGSPAFAAFDQGSFFFFENVCSLSNSEFWLCSCFSTLQDMMFFLGTFVVWFLGSMFAKIFPRSSKS